MSPCVPRLESSHHYLFATLDCLANNVINARKRSCGKVMFSQVPVCLRGRGFISSPMSFPRGSGYLRYQVPTWGVRGWLCPGAIGYVQRWEGMSKGGMSGGVYPPIPVHGTCDTLRYGRQAGGRHPTGMLSCLKIIQCHNNNFMVALCNKFCPTHHNSEFNNSVLDMLIHT